MLGSDLFHSVRVLARDDSQGASTSSRFYSDEEIGRALTSARDEGIRLLFMQSSLLGSSPNSVLYYQSLFGNAFPIRRPRITMSGLFSSVAFTASPQAVPSDFWRAECALDANSKYVKTEPAFQGDMMFSIGQKQIYLKGGKFYGTLGTVYYWANPTLALGNDATDLNADVNGYPMSDRFYHAIKYKALALLFAKEKADNLRRIALCERLFAERMSLLH